MTGWFETGSLRLIQKIYWFNCCFSRHLSHFSDNWLVYGYSRSHSKKIHEKSFMKFIIYRSSVCPLPDDTVWMVFCMPVTIVVYKSTLPKIPSISLTVSFMLPRSALIRRSTTLVLCPAVLSQNLNSSYLYFVCFFFLFASILLSWWYTIF